MSRNGHFLWWWDPAKSVTWTEKGVTLFAGSHYVRNFCVFEKNIDWFNPKQICNLDTFWSSGHCVELWPPWESINQTELLNSLSTLQFSYGFELFDSRTAINFRKFVVCRFSRITCYYILIILWLCCPFKSRKSFQKRPQNMVIFDGDWTSIFWKMFQITEG